MRFILLLLVVSGCGYQFQGSGSSLPPNIKTVWVAPIENLTKYTSLDRTLVDELKLRFNRYGAVTVSESQLGSDATLKTKVVSVDERVTGVTGDTDIALESELVMLIAAELRTRQGEVLWRNPALVTNASVASTGDLVVTSSSGFAQGGLSSSDLSQLGDREVSRSQEEEALRDLVEETARLIYLSAVAPSF